MRGMLVGKPVATVVVEPSEASVLLDPSASVVVETKEVVMVGAKVRLVGTSSVVASSVPIGTMV